MSSWLTFPFHGSCSYEGDITGRVPPTMVDHLNVTPIKPVNMRWKRPHRFRY